MKAMPCFLIPFLIVALLLQHAVAQSNPAARMWDDPDFVKSFTASYGVLSQYEPEISDAEKEALRSLLNVIKNNPRSAISGLEQQIKPNSSAAFDFILGNLHFQEGNLGKAERAYRNAVEKYPNFRRAHKNLSLVLVQAGKFGEAIPAISQSLVLGDVDGRSYGLLGYSYLTQQLYYPAAAAYRQAILMQPKVRDWKLGLGRCLVETQDYQGAIALFDTLIKQEPDNADFWLLQANAYIGIDQSLAAAENIEIVRRMGKAEVASLTMLGDIYLNNSSPRLALNAYLEALERSGDEAASASIRAARILTQNGNYDQAKTMIAKTREKSGQSLSEEDALTLLTLDAKIARAEGDEEKAFETLISIVERDALNGDALIELGNYYAQKGDFERAVNRYEQAQSIVQFERAALIAHAQTLIRKKSYADALVLLRRAQEIENDSYLADYVARVERVVD